MTCYLPFHVQLQEHVYQWLCCDNLIVIALLLFGIPHNSKEKEITIFFQIIPVIFQVAYVVSWTKQGSMLPPGATDFMGVLTIPNVRIQDAGRYVCTGSNMYEIDRGFATLTVTCKYCGVPQGSSLGLQLYKVVVHTNHVS